MKTKLIPILLLAAVALFIAGCGSSSSGATVVNGKLDEYSIDLDQTSIPAGQIHFVFENVGDIVHEVVLEPTGSEDAPFEENGVESEAEDIEPGATATLDWTLDEPGTYQLGCYVVDDDGQTHAMKGMVTTFTVTAP